MAKNVTSSVHHGSVCSSQTSLIVCDFEKEDCLGVALTLLKLLDSSLI